MRLNLLPGFAFLLLSNFCFSQNTTGPSTISAGFNQIISIKSRFVHRENYLIQVKLPDGYNDTDQQYPVIYLLDGDRSFGMARDILDWLYVAGEARDAIIVGVGFGRQDSDIIEKQIRDFTPNRDPEKQAPAFAEAGGARYFLSFIDKELIPTIESRYRTNKEKVMVGFDYGGLFCAYALFNSNRNFTDFVLVSPMLGWSGRFIFKLEEVFNVEKNKLKGNVYIINGLANSNNKIIAPSLDFAKVLQDRNYPDLHVYVRQYEDETFYSVYPVGLLYCIKTILKKQAVTGRG